MVASTITNELGAYSFESLADGTYDMAVVAPATWGGGAASPAVQTVTLVADTADGAADFAATPDGSSFWQNARTTTSGRISSTMVRRSRWDWTTL